MKIANETTSRIRLGRSQTSMFYAAHGTTIVAIQGSILVCEGGTVADTRFVVSDGECHVVQRNGWVRLEAGGANPAAAIVNAGLPPVPLWRRWWQRAHTLVALKG
ncbi:hypothetical protein SAMN04515620_12178 [Collimonas sp. OK607]|uniref:hypothetical protein n=1 Tax=Collimonas sp. OK607 TaxID=1798194 RepID=UPI0008E736AB|nr:hypothetical protein [Collimonas sp. OK607]SFB15982.1 hypothetical protein SAMN04515620_12178 [Collimonas sp. OK607]